MRMVHITFSSQRGSSLEQYRRYALHHKLSNLLRLLSLYRHIVSWKIKYGDNAKNRLWAQMLACLRRGHDSFLKKSFPYFSMKYLLVFVHGNLEKMERFLFLCVGSWCGPDWEGITALSPEVAGSVNNRYELCKRWKKARFKGCLKAQCSHKRQLVIQGLYQFPFLAPSLFPKTLPYFKIVFKMKHT